MRNDVNFSQQQSKVTLRFSLLPYSKVKGQMGRSLAIGEWYPLEPKVPTTNVSTVFLKTVSNVFTAFFVGRVDRDRSLRGHWMKGRQLLPTVNFSCYFVRFFGLLCKSFIELSASISLLTRLHKKKFSYLSVSRTLFVSFLFIYQCRYV